MKPGIYENVPLEEYLLWEALSNSDMSYVARSPAHYKYGRRQEETSQLELGSLVHDGKLSPEVFADRYVVQPAFHLDPRNKTQKGDQTNSKNTTFVREKLKEFAEQNNGKQIVEQQWFEKSRQIIASLSANEAAAKLLEHPGPAELSIAWEDLETGVLCKARIDKLSAAILADLKTTADLRTFGKSIYNYGYHRQLAHYQDGYLTLTGEELEPWIVAVETEAPYCVQAAPLSEEALEIGRQERSRLLRIFAYCQKYDDWPGPDSPDQWDVPHWVYTREALSL